MDKLGHTLREGFCQTCSYNLANAAVPTKHAVLKTHYTRYQVRRLYGRPQTKKASGRRPTFLVGTFRIFFATQTKKHLRGFLPFSFGVSVPTPSRLEAESTIIFVARTTERHKNKLMLSIAHSTNRRGLIPGPLRATPKNGKDRITPPLSFSLSNQPNPKRAWPGRKYCTANQLRLTCCSSAHKSGLLSCQR